MLGFKNVERVKPTGLDLKDRLVGVQRVTKVTKGGRAFGFSAIVVVGDENGVVGHGLGKSKDVSEAIRTPKVTGIVSVVAAIKEVRVKLVEMQRAISKGKQTILDGRDIGTAVFPNAQVKIFLVASPETRAIRRLREYEQKNISTTYEEVLEGIKERDFIDSTRKESPLVKAVDAHEIDSSNMTVDEVVNAISSFIDEKLEA